LFPVQLILQKPSSGWLIIFIASFYLWTTSGAKWIVSMPMLPIILSIVGAIGLAIAGYLGGGACN
jgi:hypothetical protein